MSIFVIMTFTAFFTSFLNISEFRQTAFALKKKQQLSATTAAMDGVKKKRKEEFEVKIIVAYILLSILGLY